jgi:hypothetical protein
MDGLMLLLVVFAVVRSISRGSAEDRETKDENDDGGHGDVDPKPCNTSNVGEGGSGGSSKRKIESRDLVDAEPVPKSNETDTC